MFDYELIKVFDMYMDFVGKLSASIPKWLDLIFLLIVYVSHCAALIHISIYYFHYPCASMISSIYMNPRLMYIFTHVYKILKY